MFCYVYRGKIPKKRQQQRDGNKRVEMRTTTTKRSLGNASIRPLMKKFRGLEQNKDPWSIGKWRHELAASDGRGCLKNTTMDNTHKTTSKGADIFGLSHEGSWNYMKTSKTCVKPCKWIKGVILLKATLMTCGTKGKIEKSLREPPSIIKDCPLSTPEDHSRWKARRLRYTLTSQDTFGDDNIPLIFWCPSKIMIRFYALLLWSW